MRRQAWAIRHGICVDCSTTPERLAAVHEATRINRLQDDAPRTTSRNTEDRINRLAAKRAARATQSQSA